MSAGPSRGNVLYPDQIKAELIRSGILTDTQVQQAEQHAQRQGIPFETAVTALELADHAKLGQCLSALSNLPYHPLLSVPPPPQVKTMIAPLCIDHWRAFPTEYNTGQHLLTMAVQDPDQAKLLDQVRNLLLEPYSLSFTIVSRSEMEKALEVHLGIQPSKSEKTAQPAGDYVPPMKSVRMPRKLAGLHARMDDKVKEAGAAASAPKSPERHKPSPVEEKPIPAEDVGRYLVSAAALLVESHLEKNSEALSEARARVRYGQLLASRLNLPPATVDKIALACWFSALSDKRHLFKRFLAPYNIEAIIFADDATTAGKAVEAQVLSLITRYQEMRRRDPASCRDVNAVRRNLKVVWSSAQERQDMLESFLQLLMDEEFLAGLSRGSGHILIVDAEEATQASLSPPLTHDGYEVSVVPSAEAALEWMAQTKPDLVICDAVLPQMSGQDLCRRVKSNRETSQVPFLCLLPAGMEKKAADCLRAGAEDVFLLPVNLEVLFLKIQRLMANVGGETARAGVAGSLDDMSFTDMIQILTAGNKSMEIVIKAEGREGRVCIREGNIIHAVAGELTGEPAFYELMSWRQGEFVTRQLTEFPTQTIQTGTMSLLMEGARLVDENGNGAKAG